MTDHTSILVAMRTNRPVWWFQTEPTCPVP